MGTTCTRCALPVFGELAQWASVDNSQQFNKKILFKLSRFPLLSFFFLPLIYTSLRVVLGYSRDAWLADFISRETWTWKLFFVTRDLKSFAWPVGNLNHSLILARKYARIFVRGHVPRSEQFLENCELGGTENVQGQVSEHIFAPNGGYCIYYPSNSFSQRAHI